MVATPCKCLLPTAADLPDADDTPVDNELQNDISNQLLIPNCANIWAS